MFAIIQSGGRQVKVTPGTTITVDRIEGRSVCGLAPGDYFEVVASNDGSFAMARPEAATPEQKARKAKKKLPPRRPRSRG